MSAKDGDKYMDLSNHLKDADSKSGIAVVIRVLFIRTRQWQKRASYSRVCLQGRNNCSAENSTQSSSLEVKPLSSQFFTRRFSLRTTALKLLIMQRCSAARIKNMARSSHAMMLNGVGREKIRAEFDTVNPSHNRLVSEMSCPKFDIFWIQRTTVAGLRAEGFRQQQEGFWLLKLKRYPKQKNHLEGSLFCSPIWDSRTTIYIHTRLSLT